MNGIDAWISKSSCGALAAGEALLEARAVELGVVIGGVEQREPAVGDLGRERDVLRPLGAQADRDALAQRVKRRLQRLAEPRDPLAAAHRERVVRAVGGDGRPPGDRVAHDPDVLARARERLRERLAVPALDDLRARHAEPEHEAAAAQVVHRHRGHRRGGRTARAHLHDRRAEPDPLGLGAPPRQRRQRVGAVGLRGPDRVEAEALGLLHGRERRRRRRTGGPVARVEAELQAHGITSRSRPAGASPRTPSDPRRSPGRRAAEGCAPPSRAPSRPRREGRARRGPPPW